MFYLCMMTTRTVLSDITTHTHTIDASQNKTKKCFMFRNLFEPQDECVLVSRTSFEARCQPAEAANQLSSVYNSCAVMFHTKDTQPKRNTILSMFACKTVLKSVGLSVQRLNKSRCDRFSGVLLFSMFPLLMCNSKLITYYYYYYHHVIRAVDCARLSEWKLKQTSTLTPNNQEVMREILRKLFTSNQCRNLKQQLSRRLIGFLSIICHPRRTGEVPWV